MKNNLDWKKIKILIVVSRFNEAITMSLLTSAKRCLEKKGILTNNIEVLEVPGALEIPLALKISLKKKEYHAALALGAVIRGNTPHFDYVANLSLSGVQQVSLETNTIIPIGILTTNNAEQALERTGIKYTNKGWEVAQTAIEMLEILTNK